MADPTARINANKGGIAPLITTEVSIFEPTPYEAYNIFAVDDSALTEFIGQPAAFGQVVRFPLRKRGGRVGKTYVDVEITVPVAPDGGVGGVSAAWVDDLGANLLEEIKVKYSSKDVHTYRGEALKWYQRLMDHDITKEHYNGNQLAGLPGVNGEQVRSNTSIGAPSVYSKGALTVGVLKLRINLDWIWWTKEDESALATEALASEIIVEIRMRRLEELIYSRLIGAPGTVADPFATPAPIARPTITECTLHHELIFTPKVEASKHLARYENRRGLMFKVLGKFFLSSCNFFAFWAVIANIVKIVATTTLCRSRAVFAKSVVFGSFIAKMALAKTARIVAKMANLIKRIRRKNSVPSQNDGSRSECLRATKLLVVIFVVNKVLSQDHNWTERAITIFGAFFFYEGNVGIMAIIVFKARSQVTIIYFHDLRLLIQICKLVFA